MSSASGVNVLRYSALAFGIFYGFTHQRAITSAQKQAAAQKEYEHKQQLIQQAKAEYSRAKNPAPASQSGASQDLADPKFDLEAYMNDLMTQKA
ncbi:ATP synthase subunit E [Xylariomycetidae sp. FL2044]|nr:ATP synthase subunit E [Xylariomycetidae sp. FL2044]